MTYPSINIQGNILSGEILEKIRNEEVNHQSAGSFGLDKNIRVRDEIGLAWSTIRGLWATFSKRRERIDPEDSGTSETRNFWMLPFLATLGYDVEKANAEIIDGKTYAISHRAINIDGFPVHISGINDSLDKRRDNSGPRLSPHALIQEYINKTEDHLYALVTNGRHIRLLRDATRLVRLAYLEFDLEKMMEEELFADFAVLYRILHATRMPRQKGEGEQAVIEIYHQDSLLAGARIREKLSEAVEFAIKQMANGFLKHPANDHLRQVIAEGHMSADVYYLHSLRLIYRVLFLLVIEDRGLVYPDKRDAITRKQRQIYQDYYSISRLRKLASRRLYVDGAKHDLWENLKVSFRLFEQQQAGQKLGLQALGSGIFSPDALGVLSYSTIDNVHLLDMMQRLSYFRDDDRKIWVKVNYSDLDVEEFGSVYEGLLEYQPVFTSESSLPGFSFVKGDARSKSGSHYTPEELVRPLIKHSLDYIIDDCLKKPQERLKNLPANTPLKTLQEKALLGITVCDVACGSGHILLSAARRIATELAKVRTGEDQPTPSAMRYAIRDTIRTCIYGVDKNPLAVELCKVALWLEAHNPGEPLNFLDHRIKCGDSIIGLAHRNELENGIADEAFKTLPGDNKEIAKSFRDQNIKDRKERVAATTQLKADFEKTTGNSVQESMAEYKIFKQLPETTPDEIARKARAYQKFIAGKGFTFLKAMADTQVAQFFIPKTLENKEALMTDTDFRQMLSGYKGWQDRKTAKAAVVALENRFFHWFLEFPEVFGEGGFDCILGNPPYLGGSKISGSYGIQYLNSIQYLYDPIGGVSDLITYFLRRDHNICKSNGFISLITTNSIIDGNTREFGLEFLIKSRSNIIYASKSIKWPGAAKIVVSLFSLTKGLWSKERYLDNKQVKYISPFFSTEEDLGTPESLYDNQDICFKGTSFLGDGFLITHSEMDILIKDNAHNENVINELINGQDINENFDLAHSRLIINFFDWPETKAAEWSLPFKVIEERVKPERLKSTQKPLREKWWLYERSRMQLYNSIKKKNFCFVAARTTKYWNVIPYKTNSIVFSDSTVVFDKDNLSFYSLIQNSLHEIWVQKYSSSLATTLIYTVNSVFETFPFPQNLSSKLENQLEIIGEACHIHRRQILLAMKLGLTKTYNAFHGKEIQAGITKASLQSLDKKAIEKQHGKEVWNLWNHLQKTPGTCSIEEAISGIVKLRELHVEMDNAVLEAYGWQDVQLKHDFYEVDYLPENDRVRFTIHPEARKEILKRLLELNHQLFEQEAHEGLHKEETVRKFYEQKGISVPEEVSKWFNKTKKYKTLKPKSLKVEEDGGGYGDLFEQTL
jgi:hypothetical protein